MLIPVILSGGAGSRLWPVSRETHPKPFIQLADGQSLLQKTFLRASALAGVSEVLTVTNRDYYFKTKDEYLACKTKARSLYLLEPCGRNTAPAIALAALLVRELHGSDAMMLVLPADHLIANQSAFAQAVEAAQALAREDNLVTFGIQPTAPETGFGYIEASETLVHGRRVARFVEKPDAQKATEYVATGNFFWNSGMFCFKAGTLLNTMSTTCPDVLQAAEVCWAAAKGKEAGMVEFDTGLFVIQPDISIDFAVMEKANNVVVVPCELGWSDIGSWTSLGDLVPPDAQGNRTIGDTVIVDSINTFVQSEHRLVAVVGVSDLIVVDTPDAVLVAHKDKAQDVRNVVKQLKSNMHEAYRLHRTVSRPWGTYTVLEESRNYKIKRIEVKPGASLSLQMHHHRCEHWIVVSGMAKVTIDDREFFVGSNESTYISAGHKHRLENPGTLDLVMIEVQSGEYLGEDDIVRFQDSYGRC